MDYNLNRQDKYYLIILGIISTLLVIHTIKFALNNFGVFDDDIYFYLGNSLKFAGVVSLQDNTQIFYGPLICFLTSFLIRAGIDGILSIYIVTGILAIFGNLGLYLLLRLRFRELLSFTGVVIYSGLSLYCMWVACGNLDIPAISMTIWCIYFIISAINKNPKYHIPALICLVLGVFIRYTVVLIIPVILTYIIYKIRFKLRENKKTRKYFLISLIIIIIGVISFISVLILYKSNNGFLNQIYAVLIGRGVLPTDPYYNQSRLHYIKNTLEYISSYNAIFRYGENYHLVNPTPLSYFLISILGIGIILCYDKLKQLKINKKMVIITILLSIITFGSLFIRISTISIILSMLTILLAHETLKDSGFKNLDFNLLMLGWLLCNLIFYSLYGVKVNRYILTAAPPFIYFVICAVNKIEVKFENKVKIKTILPILLIILFLINGFSYITTIDNELFLHAEEETSHFLMEYDTNLSNATIASTYPRTLGYYLQHKVIEMFDYEVDSSGVTYYISYGDINPPLNNYDLIYHNKENHNMHIFKKKELTIK